MVCMFVLLNHTFFSQKRLTNEIAVSRIDLVTEVFNEIKTLQLRMHKKSSDFKRKQLDNEFYSELRPTENTSFNNFVFFQKFNITESKILSCLMILFDDNDVLSKFIYDS